MITLCIPTYSQFDSLIKNVYNAFEGTTKPDLIHIIDNSPEGSFYHDFGSIPVRIDRFNGNIGVSAAWNTFMRQHDDLVVISNDDVFFSKDTVNIIVSNVPDSGILIGSSHTKNEFSLFCLRKQTWTDVGKFDEQFYPAYFEDNDYYRRLLLANCVVKQVDMKYTHEGSATVRKLAGELYNTHVKQFVANEQRYIKKWGGLPGKETYLIPYNKEV